MATDLLFGSTVRSALAAVPAHASDLQAVSLLRQHLPADVARRAAEQRMLRQRASRRFEPGRFDFLTRKGLEQATRTAVANARGQRIATRATGIVWDATCGIGSDSIALAERGVRVIASDLDAETASFAHANLARFGRSACVIQTDALARTVRASGLVLDPDRRARSARRAAAEQWSPSISESLRLAGAFEGACLKLAPAFEPDEVSVQGAANWQWVSLDGDLLEVALWLGAWADEGAEREVLSLATTREPCSLQGKPVTCAPLAREDLEHFEWLAEPDPAVIRAGLLGNVARAAGMAPVAREIAYLGGPQPKRSPLLRTWRVLDRCRADQKQVRTMLRRHDIGPLTVKKRGHPDASDTLAKRFRGRGSKPGLVCVFRSDHGHRALLLEAPSP